MSPEHMYAFRDELMKIALARIEKDAGFMDSVKSLFGRGAPPAAAAKAVGRRFHPTAGLATAAQEGGTAYRQAARGAASQAQRRGDALAANIGGL